MILPMINDLTKDSELREAFLSDPNSIMSQYNIEPEIRNKLRKGGFKGIEEHLHQESTQILQELLVEISEIVAIPWLEPTLDVNGISPTSSNTGEVINFQVQGTGFAQNATLTFKRPNINVRADVSSVVSNPDGTTTLNATAEFSVPGSYDVEVKNPTPPQESGTLPMGFTAQTP